MEFRSPSGGSRFFHCDTWVPYSGGILPLIYSLTYFTVQICINMHEFPIFYNICTSFGLPTATKLNIFILSIIIYFIAIYYYYTADGCYINNQENRGGSFNPTTLFFPSSSIFHSISFLPLKIQIIHKLIKRGANVK